MRKAVMLAAMLAVPATADSIAQGGGNLPPDFYPTPRCEAPDQATLGKPPEAQNREAMQIYNFKVQAFNKKAQAFNACMKEYVVRAQNDINVIEAIVHTAVLKANAH